MTRRVPEPEGRAALSAGLSMSCHDCGSRVLILSVGDSTSVLTCCGAPMSCAGPARCSAGIPRGALVATATRPGVVYVDEPTGLVARCTQGGTGAVGVHGRPLVAAYAPVRQLFSSTS